MFRILRSLENPAHHLQTRYGLFDEIEGEFDSGGGGSTGADGDPKAGEEGKRKPDDAGNEPPKDGKWIPKHRFDEVNQGYTEYKTFGTPAEIKAGLARLRELEALPANRTTDKEKTEIRKELMSVFPELRVMSDMLSVQKEAYTERGAGMNEGFLKELGIEHNDSTNQYLQELLTGIIAGDKKLLRRFYAMDNDVFKDAFSVAKKTFWPNAKKPVIPGSGTQAKKLPAAIPPKQKDGNGDGKSKKDGEALDRMGERDLLDEAGNKAFELLEAARSE